jgi:hypothetical protein
VAVKIIKSKAPFRIQAQTEIELLLSLREMDSDDIGSVCQVHLSFSSSRLSPTPLPLTLGLAFPSKT